jgi:hypothetical protein
MERVTLVVVDGDGKILDTALSHQRLDFAAAPSAALGEGHGTQRNSPAEHPVHGGDHGRL